MMLIGNKADLGATAARRVKSEDAQAQADAWNMPYMETSAKTYQNVDEAFFRLLLDIHRKKKAAAQAQAATSKKKGGAGGKKKRKCCIL